ncbi:MAG: hypothetical protein JSS10_09320 [Verrucomicrobia bacterium]|nr:hypothetical protein [Verrucomicrobiota bacterium]
MKKISIEQCRVFLKTPEGNLKKIYSIRAHQKGKFIQAQIMSNQMCQAYEIPLDSEIHYQCPSNGKDFHLSIKYENRGPFDDPNILKEENYLSIYSSQDSYKHKQVIIKIDGTSIKLTHDIELTEEMRIRSLVDYVPDPFDKYLKCENQHRIYYFPTVSTPIAPLSLQKLEERPWEKGDRTNNPPTNNDIVIEESEEPNVRINVCGFFCTPGYYTCKDETKHQAKLISSPCMPDVGISVIFS